MMWNLSQGEEFLPQTSVFKLRQLYRKEGRAKPKLRLLAALHRKRGLSLDAIAQQLQKPRRTVHSWLQGYQKRGLEAKDPIPQTGRPPKLTPRQRRALLRRLEAGPPYQPGGLWTSRQVRELIARRYGVKYRAQHVWRILCHLGFSLQQPRPRHPESASPVQIARFKKKPAASAAPIGSGGLWWARRMRLPSD
jgi:transposase